MKDVLLDQDFSLDYFSWDTTSFGGKQFFFLVRTRGHKDVDSNHSAKIFCAYVGKPIGETSGENSNRFFDQWQSPSTFL